MPKKSHIQKKLLEYLKNSQHSTVRKHKILYKDGQKT